jgi:methionyl-tRNA formyltransferase
VVTQPDRPRGRGKKTTPPPVKVAAEKLGLPLYQPEDVRSSQAIERIVSMEAQCLVVVAYGQIVPKKLLGSHPLGAVNVHPSLLPKYRGAAPIQRALLAGDHLTGVSIMLLDEGIDSGPILSQEQTSIAQEDSCGSLHDKLARKGADLLCRTLKKWRSGLINPSPQDDSQVVYAPPIAKEELQFRWDWSAHRILNTIRAFDPWPGAYCLFEGDRLKCFKARPLPWTSEGAPGEVLGLTDEGFVVLAGDGRAVCIGELQKAGHRRLEACSFIQGCSIPTGARLE